MANRVEFEPDMAGIRELFHSDGIQSALSAQAERIASGSNMAAQMRTRNGLNVPAYESGMDQGKFTSIATVSTHSTFGKFDNAKHHTLESYNH